MVETLGEDYIRTAKAKGLPPRTVVYRHALRSALVPVVTIFGIDLGVLLAGTIFTERIFDIDGIGFWGLQAVYSKDLPIVEATALFTAIMVIISQPARRHRLQPPGPESEALVSTAATTGHDTDPDTEALGVPVPGEPYLVVNDLTVRFPTEDGLVTAVRTSATRSSWARRSASWGSRARASRSPRWPCWACTTPARPRSPAPSGSAAPRSSGSRSRGCASCAATRSR